MKPIDNKPQNKHIKHNRQMEGQSINPYLLQEPEHFNKPSKLIRQVIDTPLTTRQKKIYSFVLRELLKKENKSNEITTTVKDMCDFLGTDNRHIREDLKRISKTTIVIEEVGRRTTTAQLLSSYTMPKEQDLDKSFEMFRTLTIRFDTRLTEILNEIYSYAKLDLTVIKKLKNTNSLTLYEIFKRRLIKTSAGRLNLTEKELRKYLNLEDKYLDIRDFNKHLKMWIKEIEDNSNMSITWEKRKRNKINTYAFLVSDFLVLDFNTFRKRILKMKNISDLIFTYEKRKYFLIDTENNLDKLYITDYEKYMSYGDKKHLNNFNKSFTLPKEEAKIVWENMYSYFLNNQFIFLYKFFIKNDLDLEMKSISEMELNEVIEEKLSEYFDHFQNVESEKTI
jgi:hypothetical protein